jgi:hypothetical protein
VTVNRREQKLEIWGARARTVIGHEAAEELVRLHETLGEDICAANREGLGCCIDYLTDEGSP